ncbi:MAG: nuclear transport factor 2 family protein [Acaryochloridaceae cyanobacterium SU_2_1]|nr:nuclear transport factor 2 family protein [Acaryochloridaceae cyanobacterium SU_2_1]
MSHSRRQPLRSLLMGLMLACVCSTSVSWNAQQALSQPSQLPKAPIPTAPKAPVPPALIAQLAKVDAAANQKSLETLIDFYSPDFVNSDGLNREALKQTIKAFWQDYQTLTYKTEVLSWATTAQGGYTVETNTTVMGSRPFDQGTLQLQSSLKGRQTWLNGRITQQEVIAEQSQMTSGANPPEVKVNLPQEVTVGQKFDFDVVVAEPLGEKPLLGVALEEPITKESYLTQPALKLELLPAGGLFKVGQAPSQPANHWISAILVQEGGMTIVSHRLKVVQRSTAAQPKRQ